MYDGMAQSYEPKTRRLSLTRFDEFAFDIAGLIDQGGAGRDARNIRELSTYELLSGNATLADEVGVEAWRLRVEGHQRFSQPLMAAAAPLMGFAALLLGGFSRFGIWNQIFLAVGLVIGLYTLDNALQDQALKAPDRWGLVYTPPLVGLAATAVMLWLAANPGLLRRRPPVDAGGADA